MGDTLGWLEDELKRKNEEAWDHYKSMVKKISNRMLDNWRGNLPHFTNHGEEHSEIVIERLERILPQQDKRTSKLEKDLWWGSIQLLLYASFLHDVGLGFNSKDGNILTPDETRELHNILGEDFVKEKWDVLNLKNDKFGQALGRIIYAHPKSVDLNKIRKDFPVIDTIPLRKLAALIRLADALDCDIRRKQWYDGEYRICNDPIAMEHQRACDLIGSVSFDTLTKTIYINCFANSLRDKKTVLWKFQDIFEDFSSVKDILNENDINWIYLKIKINDDNPLFYNEVKEELESIDQQIKKINERALKEKFRADLQFRCIEMIRSVFTERSKTFEDTSYVSPERKTILEALKIKSDFYIQETEKNLPTTLHSEFKRCFFEVLKDIESDPKSNYVRIMTSELNEFTTMFSDEIADGLDDALKVQYLQIILGFLEKQFKMSINPFDLKIQIFNAISDQIIARIYIRAVELGLFTIDPIVNRVVDMPPLHELSPRLRLLSNLADMVKSKISVESENPAVKSSAANLRSLALDMSIDDCDFYLQKSVESILLGIGLLGPLKPLSSDAFSIKKSRLNQIITEYNIVPHDAIQGITDDIAHALSNFQNKNQLDVADIEMSFRIYESLTKDIMNVYGIKDTQKSKSILPEVDSIESVLHMFTLWPIFSNIPERYRTRPVLTSCILAWAFCLYGFDKFSSPKLGKT
jgi:hypothetical protein